MYQLITRGGDAELEFTDSMDPFTERIVFTVRPPLKSWKKWLTLAEGKRLSLLWRLSSLYITANRLPFMSWMK